MTVAHWAKGREYLQVQKKKCIFFVLDILPPYSIKHIVYRPFYLYESPESDMAFPDVPADLFQGMEDTDNSPF